MSDFYEQVYGIPGYNPWVNDTSSNRPVGSAGKHTAKSKKNKLKEKVVLHHGTHECVLLKDFYPEDSFAYKEMSHKASTFFNGYRRYQHVELIPVVCIHCELDFLFPAHSYDASFTEWITAKFIFQLPYILSCPNNPYSNYKRKDVE